MIDFKRVNKLIFIIFMGVIFLPIIDLSSQDSLNTDFPLLHISEADSSPITSKISDSSDTVIGLPSTSPSNPKSNESVTVTLSIHDVDDIRNATMFYEYLTNNSQGSVTLTNTSDLLESVTAFEETDYITNTGVNTGDETNWTYGYHDYEAPEGVIISRLDLNIIKSEDQNYIVYVKIESKNSTGDWTVDHINGTIGGTTDLDPDDDGYGYTSTKPVLGYRIFAILHYGDHPAYKSKEPELDPLDIYHMEYSGVIPAANQPTFVSYYIKVFDMLNNSAISNTYTFLMDWTPDVTLYDIPTAIQSNHDYILNVSVSDLDGVGDINDSTVIAYYRLDGESEWISVNLAHLFDFAPLNTAFYNGTIPTSNIVNLETDLHIMVNASDVWGRTASSGDISVIIDSLNPRVTNIDVEGFPGLENITLTTSEVNITAEFTDPAGISSIFIYYSVLNGTDPIKKEMTNTTLSAPEISPLTYFVTLPAANETAFVEYFFETTDFFGNTGNTSSNFFYADALAPLLNEIVTIPLVISNNTDTSILFNVSDYSGLRQSVLWYSFDEATTWNSTVARPIDYTNQTKYNETFRAENLPFLIEDHDTSYLPLEVSRGGGVDAAILTLEIDHENPSDLRVWLLLDDGRRILIFDREPGPNIITLEIELFALGLEQSDFTRANFTLETQDFSELYSGSIKDFKIKLIDYAIPLGYQFIATIPSTNVDTTVMFYITLTDKLWNAKNTSMYQYYSDGLSPNITVHTVVSPLDLAGGLSIEISAEITDTGGVLGADIYYKFSNSSDWNVKSMSLNLTTGFFVVGVPIPTESGTLMYKIRAFDLSGLSSETTVYTIEFTNGFAPIIIVQDTPFPSPLDMQGSQFIRVRANVTDDGTVVNVTIYYRFSNDSDWIIANMSLESDTNLYYFDVLVPTSEGYLTFKISATDNSGLTSETEIYTLEFINGQPSGEDILGPIIIFGSLVLVIGASGAGVVYLIRKRLSTGAVESIETMELAETEEPPE